MIRPGDLPTRFTAFFDGCCEPKNPGGTAGYGCVIFDAYQRTARSELHGERVFEYSGMIPAHPTTSNNIAEYVAVKKILEWLIANNHHHSSCQIFGDSRLVISQMWGFPVHGQCWKINGIDTDKPKGFYADTAVETRELVRQLPRALGYWIPRAENSLADELSKAELRDAGIEFAIQPEDDETEAAA